MKILYVREHETDIEFDEFQQCLAMALCRDHPQLNLCLAALAEELPKELEAAVFAGKLPVKNPLKMGPELFPIGESLRTSRVLVSDIRTYVAERGVSVAVMPEVVKQACITTVDPLLLGFPSSAPVHYTDNIGSGNGRGICSVGDYIDLETDRIKRQAEGYFTVDEAAQILADSRDGIDVGEMIQRMKNAVVKGLRLARNPGDRLPIVNDEDFREYASLVKILDVDAWLESQGVDYRFPVNKAAPAILEPQGALVCENEIRLPAGATHVGYSMLSCLLTEAQWPVSRLDETGMGKFATRAGHKQELKDAALDGSLPLKDPVTKGPLKYLLDHVIESSLVTVTDFQAYAKLRNIDVVVEQLKSDASLKPWATLMPFFDPIAGLYMYQQAAYEIASAEGWDDSKLEALEAEMVSAIHDGSLPRRSRKTGRVISPQATDALLLVTVDDVNEWLVREGLPYRWSRSNEKSMAQLAPQQAVATPAPVEVVSLKGEQPKAAQLPLTTGDIAFCFDGLRWTERQWKKPLGDKPKWLQTCIQIPGQRGISETRWNPVFIGAALVRKGHVEPKSVRAKFQTKPLLKPWLEAWKTHEAEYIESK